MQVQLPVKYLFFYGEEESSYLVFKKLVIGIYKCNEDSVHQGSAVVSWHCYLEEKMLR